MWHISLLRGVLRLWPVRLENVRAPPDTTGNATRYRRARCHHSHPFPQSRVWYGLRDLAFSIAIEFFLGEGGASTRLESAGNVCVHSILDITVTPRRRHVNRNVLGSTSCILRLVSATPWFQPWFWEFVELLL